MFNSFLYVYQRVIIDKNTECLDVGRGSFQQGMVIISMRQRNHQELVSQLSVETGRYRMLRVFGGKPVVEKCYKNNNLNQLVFRHGVL